MGLIGTIVATGNLHFEGKFRIRRQGDFKSYFCSPKEKCTRLFSMVSGG